MEPTIHVQPGPVRVEQEGILHFFAREGRVALRWIIGISLVATLAVMVSPLLFLAPIPALILLASYILFMLTREVERRADPVADREFARRETAGDQVEIMEDAGDLQQVHPDTMRLVKREGKTGVAILAVVMTIGLLIAFFTLPWEVVAIGALVVAAYMLLVAAPVLMGWIEDDIEITEARQAQEHGAEVETEQQVTPDDRTVPAMP